MFVLCLDECARKLLDLYKSALNNVSNGYFEDFQKLSEKMVEQGFVRLSETEEIKTEICEPVVQDMHRRCTVKSEDTEVNSLIFFGYPVYIVSRLPTSHSSNFFWRQFQIYRIHKPTFKLLPGVMEFRHWWVKRKIAENYKFHSAGLTFVGQSLLPKKQEQEQYCETTGKFDHKT